MNSAHIGANATSFAEQTWIPAIGIPALGVLVAVMEASLIALASVASGVAYETVAIGGVAEVDRFFAVGIMASVLVLLMAQLRSLYSAPLLLKAGRQLQELALIWTAALLLLVSVGFALKIGSVFSRGAVFTFGVFGFVLIAGHRLAWRRFLVGALQSAQLRPRPVALVAFQDAASSSSVPTDLLKLGLAPVCSLSLPGSALGTGEFDSTLRRFCSEVRGAEVDAIYVLANWTDLGGLAILLDRLRPLPLPVHLLAEGALAEVVSRPTLATLEGRSIVEVRRAPLGAAELAVKRAFDLFVAFAALALLSPILAAVAIAVRLDSPGPILFRQHRLGFNGRKFAILKFRSMTVQENGDVVTQATRDDPRVTRVGRFIRRTSLDELPQLFNVLAGDMSLVGPRPHAVAHDDLYDSLIADYALRRHVRPGLTGWAQVNGCRGETPTMESMKARVDHDLWYIDHWTCWLDLKILGMTALMLLRSENAY
ncbi:undecaprenyl-phosphate glucose phosphotransferase [Alsobacter sp. KACC 23698]|uniref:Undecaprenyl-phosphate glucose phosphotransferase n=1 Tax=Alsobacter sp. KACC 23698 TaxID=3149229 RepID=A0AAU7JJS8_9HYPH